MNELINFIKRYNYAILFVILEVVAFLLISKNSQYQSSRMIGAGNAVAGRFYRTTHSIGSYFGLRKENQHLAAENAKLREQLKNSYLSYTDSVFSVNDTTYRQRYSYIEAEVIKNSWNGQKNYIMLNKGSLQGVEPDMAVISPQGIVGIVVNTTRNFSTVMPVLHPDSRNSVKTKRDNLSGTLQWEGGNYRNATVTDIPTTHKIYIGDTIITSGFANDFPEGVLVGYVISKTSKPGSGFYNIKVRLSTEFNNLKNVYVVNNRFREEQDSLKAVTNY
ncbi:MAG: rod shape-determining protein MreC [Bacteroidales bacterium]|nr:rod shape-determining protein MreC [Bacteroidales bacterium]MBQ9474380.1 rod shape-determining protein MreC [Bacteroidales bacterium]